MIFVWTSQISVAIWKSLINRNSWRSRKSTVSFFPLLDRSGNFLNVVILLRSSIGENNGDFMNLSLFVAFLVEWWLCRLLSILFCICSSYKLKTVYWSSLLLWGMERNGCRIRLLSYNIVKEAIANSSKITKMFSLGFALRNSHFMCLCCKC